MTIIFVVSACLSVCLLVCLFVCAEFFSGVFDPILLKTDLFQYYGMDLKTPIIIAD